MGYKLKKHSGAQTFQKSSSFKTRSANRNHILSKQSTKRKDIIEALINLVAILKVVQKLTNN